MDEEYDVIILGTGLKECILSGLLSMAGKKILHMDRNNYYGGSCASLNQEQLNEKFGGADGLVLNKKYNIDLVPKFILAAGSLVQILLKTQVTKYLEFKVVDGSYIYKKGKIYKVPTTADEVRTSNLIGFMEKFRVGKFFTFLQNYHPSNHKNNDTMKSVFSRFGLSQGTIDIIGHAIALHHNDDYLDQPADLTIKKCQRYIQSVSCHGKSPYIYPSFGLGELPQAFARLSAVHGGTYMLNQTFSQLFYNEQGQISGLQLNETHIKCHSIIADPSYFPDKIKKIGQVIRVICILLAPIPQTKNSASCQIIIPHHETKRQSDIYISLVSSTHNVCDDGKYIATVSTIIETDNPLAEIDIALKLLGSIIQQFVSIENLYEPINTNDRIFITSSYDATSNFESICSDVHTIYKNITGQDLDTNRTTI